MADQRRRTIEALHGVATTIQTQKTAEGVCEQTVSAAADILEFNLCSVIIREDGWLVPYAVSEGAPPGGSRPMRIDHGLAGKTYETGSSHIVSAVSPDDETDPAKDTYRSAISVPVGDQGVFQAVSTTTDAFSENDIELVELLVSHAATALDRIEREQELKRQNDRLDQFASVVSHDLQNPLNVASLHLELAADECDSPHLQNVADAHDRMEQLIDDLLLFARVGTDAIDREPVALAALFETCWNSFDTDEATLTVETDRKVQADHNRLQQLAENLLKNALEHGRDDCSITVGALDDGFYVEDDGPGILESEREDVFEAGYSSTDSGTGFGLSIVKQIVDAHDWVVRVTEGSAGGARFEITDVDFTRTQ